ncbi:MAG TPA: APC family permease [Actinomycetota bacterium]
MDTGSKELGYERLGAKKLSLIDVVAQSVGFMGPVFSAAFLIPLIAGLGAAGKGAGIATPFAVLLSAVGVFALGWIVATYARRVHAAGSLYDYVSQGLGDTVGAVTGWVYYGGTTVLASAIAVLIGGLTHDILLGEYNVEPLQGWMWSLIYVVAIFLIMYLGVRISTRVQLTLALVSAAVVLGFFVYVIFKVGGDNSLKALNPGEAADGWSGIFFGVLYGVLIFVGFETAANLAEETAEPKRSIPRAILLSVVIVTAFYLIASYAQVAGFGFDLGNILGPAAAAPLFALGSPASAGGYGSTFMVRLLEIVVLLDIAAVGLGAAVASTRGVFALARDRRIPGALAVVSKSRGTPAGSILFVSLWSLAMVFVAERTTVFALEGQPEYFALFAWLSTFGGFALVIVYAAMSLGAFREVGEVDGKAGLVIAAILGLAISVGAIFGAVYKVPAPTDLTVWYVLGWLVLGVVVVLLVKGREPASRVLGDLRSGEGTPSMSGGPMTGGTVSGAEGGMPGGVAG